MIPENNNWKEVSKKTQPCPLCDRFDWCYLAENGEAVVCGRTDPNKAPIGWRYMKDAVDGRPIFAVENERPSYSPKTPSRSNRPPSSPTEQLSSRAPKEIRLARLPHIPSDRPQPKPNQVPQWLIDQGIPYHANETRYSYSKTQWVIRYDWENPKNPKGHCKTIRQCHLKADGKVKWSKGDSQWLPYRFDEAISVSPFANAQNAQKLLTPSPSFANAPKNQWLLVVEGEECLETARSLGLVAITWQGSSWTEAEILPPLQRLKNSGFLGIVKFRDSDGEGEDKAKKLQLYGHKVGLDVIVLDPKAIWADIPEKGDIVDWVQWGQAQGMKPEEFIEILERESQLLYTERSVCKPSQPAAKPTGADRLKLEIQAYLQSPDIFDKVRMKGQICSSYRINSQDFTLLCQALERQNSTPLPNSFDFSSFMEMGTDALEWIVPGILPKGETVLLAAQAKCGKTLLATDIAYSVLSGGQVLGEQVGVKGRVLLISSDESQNSTRRRLKARGFDLLPESDNLRIMTTLDISDLSPLEKELEDFRPHLVIIDSLTSITRDSGLNEKDAEFARPLYKLKDLLGKYGAAGILIHHQNKDKEAKGINKVSGSARIVAAVWGVWQIIAKDPNNEQDTIRWLKVKPREGEAVTLTLGINPKDTWAGQGIFNFISECGDESGAKRTQGEKVMEHDLEG